MTTTALTPTAVPTSKPTDRRRRSVGLHLALIAGFVVMIMPFVWMILSSFKLTRELRRSPTRWIPEEPTLQNYRDLWDRLDFPRYFFNSTIVAVGVTAGNLLFCSMLGYALAKLQFPGKRPARCDAGTLMVP